MSLVTINRHVEIMEMKMKESSKLLGKSPAKRCCCIFRVPQSLVETNKEVYQPRVVSIGPYHYGNKDLEMIQEHKYRFLNNMISRTGKPLLFFMNIMLSKEHEIRESYSESIDHLRSYDLATMMLLDGVFLIELFRITGRVIFAHVDDPIFRVLWISFSVMSDILMIENQIPFSVLQELFNESNLNTPTPTHTPTHTPTPTLKSLILKFFNHAVDRHPNVLKGCENLEGKHLLDFFRVSFIHSKKERRLDVYEDTRHRTISLTPKLIQPATSLVTAGIKFKANHQANSFLDIEFQNGLFSIPHINLDGFFVSFLMNCIAFEESYVYCSKDITMYIVFMGCLINTSADVSLLSQNKVIENHFGTGKETAKIFGDAGKSVTVDVNADYLSGLFMEVNEYCKNEWNIGWAGFKRTYFESPWVSVSAFAAFMLLSFAALQTLYTVFGYYK